MNTSALTGGANARQQHPGIRDSEQGGTYRAAKLTGTEDTRETTKPLTLDCRP